MDPTNAPSSTPLQQQSSEAPEKVTPPEMPEKKYGPTIGIVIIIALIVLGGLYLWGAELTDKESVDDASDPIVEKLESQSSSDDVSSIEADLNANTLEDLDQGLQDIEGDLQVQ